MAVGRALNTSFLSLSLQEIEGDRPRRMDRLRRSLRSSMRRKKHRDAGSAGAATGGAAASGGTDASGKPNVWKQDEISVRSGTCSFSVKVRCKNKGVAETGSLKFGFYLFSIWAASRFSSPAACRSAKKQSRC